MAEAAAVVSSTASTSNRTTLREHVRLTRILAETANAPQASVAFTYAPIPVGLLPLLLQEHHLSSLMRDSAPSGVDQGATRVHRSDVRQDDQYVWMVMFRSANKSVHPAACTATALDPHLSDHLLGHLHVLTLRCSVQREPKLTCPDFRSSLL